ncbi:ferric reductase like protein [Haloactinopolyspora alba]|uniref:Ferric reductase like protein n=1 Tax=Haloactinopolyspora alba TaxID=648780 RepID=A0A2P8EC33_9ACTN|nr:ferric reductase-like transmembrane domain-containing protein [Haloactinopolyspora alba]PSL07022.1 ferric reductase like protein [Haloactinopolyspora alba]
MSMPDFSRTRGARPRRFDTAELGRDLRAASWDAGAALAVTIGLFVWFYRRVETGASATVQIMPMLADADRYWLYWLCQAFGWAGLLWAWITVMLGLVRSSSRPGGLRISAARLEKWHRTTSLTTIGLMFAHALAFFAERVRGNGDGHGAVGRVFHAFVEVFVPGGYDSGTGRTAILLGLLAFYMAIPLGLAYYYRQATGSRVWRTLHRFVIVVYVLSVWHTLLYGTSVWFDGWFRTTVWLLQIPVAALLLIRLLAPARPSERLRRDRSASIGFAARAAGRVTVAATVVVLLVVAASGRDGGRTPGGESAELTVTQAMIWAGLAALVLVVGVAVHRSWRLARRPSR